MIINKHTKLFFTIAIGGLLSTNIPSYAKSTSVNASRCELGQECAIPGDNGGHTYFSIKPENGMSYSCVIKSDGGSLKTFVKGGKDFHITQGYGIYNANPENVISIKGRFDKPNDPQDKGEIRFHKLPLSSDGTVKCSQES
jgi:hypothetical protein